MIFPERLRDPEESEAITSSYQSDFDHVSKKSKKKISTILSDLDIRLK